MVKSSKGSRSRTRGVMTKSARTRGVLPVTRHLQHFEPGDRVILRLEPSWHKGQPHPRYQGRVCIVVAKVGRAYRLEFLDGHKHKELIALPIHLLRADQPAGAA
jgi:large subunit ribosomal protein L21e